MAEFHSILPGAVLADVGPQDIGNKAWNLMLMASRCLRPLCCPRYGAVDPCQRLNQCCTRR